MNGNSAPAIIAHRGIRDELPENTRLAIEAALKLPGLAGVEFDVELSDLPVVLHQETLVPDASFTRLTLAERDYVSRDWVSRYTQEEIRELDAGSWFNESFSELRVPSLKEILALEWGSKTAYVELKDATFWGKRDLGRPARIVAAVLQELIECRASIDIVSFNPEILREIHREIPRLSLTLALWTEFRGRYDAAMEIAVEVGASTISIAETMALECRDWVRSAHEKGLKIQVYPVSPVPGEPEFENWTASSQVSKWERLAAMGIDAILSDFPRHTLAVFSTR